MWRTAGNVKQPQVARHRNYQTFLVFCVRVYTTYINKNLIRSLYAIAVRLSVSLSPVGLTFGHPTQAIEIFGNVSMPFNTLAIY